MPSIPAAAWPSDAGELVALQITMGRTGVDEWRPGPGVPFMGACFVCFGPNVHGRGEAGEPAWAGAAAGPGRRPGTCAVVRGSAAAPYGPGLLALREGALLEAAVRALPEMPEVLLVNATGRDHPRRFGLASHLGAVLGIPTVGVTHRALLASGPDPHDRRGAGAPLTLDGEIVGYWLRTRRGARPIAVHAAWRTDARTAVEVVLIASRRARTPEPLRRARRAARMARAASLGGGGEVTPY